MKEVLALTFCGLVDDIINDKGNPLITIVKLPKIIVMRQFTCNNGSGVETKHRKMLVS